MKKIIISVLILALIIGTGIWWYSNQKRETQKPIIENESNYTAERSSTKTEQSEVNESNNNNNTKADVPKTGDNIVTYVIIFLASAVALTTGLVLIRRKK